MGKIRGKVEALEDSDIITDLMESSSRPSSHTVVHEVLNFETHLPDRPLKQIKFLESLPEVGLHVLTSFLILTPYETYNTNPDKKKSDHRLKKLQAEQATPNSIKNKKFEDKLQNMPFNVINPRLQIILKEYLMISQITLKNLKV